ncbi:MAG: hypothetical protein KAU28_03190 [Phycisphaerae bacterium]|nr:hypothetical protein [Phycisphaerae bacterium]
MPVNVLGFQTHRDHFAVAFDKETILARFETLRDGKQSDQEITARYKLRDNRDWHVRDARAAIMAKEAWKEHAIPCLYRPFDIRWCYFNTVAMDYPRRELLDHVAGKENICLLVPRQISFLPWRHAAVCDTVAESCLVSTKTKEQNYNFPLYLYPKRDTLGFTSSRRANFSDEFLSDLADALQQPLSGQDGLPGDLTPEDILYYTCAVFHSPGYRSRYADFLKTDFPRLPLPGSLELFRALARRGANLVALHLLESPKLDDHITRLVGTGDYQVEKVSYSDETVWIDKAKTRGFRGVPEEVWNFHIGGYQVCEKWLKDRQAKGGKKPRPGRVLTEDDLAHYQKIVVALAETLRIMAEIDEVIEAHGGWPDAFQTAEAKAKAATVVPFKLRLVEPTHEERYVTCVPLVPLKAAAGAFSNPQHVEDHGWEWVVLDTQRRLRPGMFVAQVVGKSMEPAIADGSYCLFAAPVTGTRQGKTVLVQLRDATDPETGERYTVKRYESEKTQDNDSWRHAKITLKPINPDFEPIVLTGNQEGELQVIAELVEVLSTGAITGASSS